MTESRKIQVFETQFPRGFGFNFVLRKTLWDGDDDDSKNFLCLFSYESQLGVDSIHRYPK